jgi:peptide/nickel transport system permease protein
MTTEAARLATPAVPRPRARRWLSGMAQLAYSPTGTIGLLLVLLWVVAALLAPWIATHSPTANNYAALANPRPSAQHFLGTDMLGRDLYSRILFGARTVLTVAPIATGGALALGALFGLLAGYRGGLADIIVSRVCDILLSFPVIILYLIVIVNFGPSMFNIIAVITVTKAPIIARIVRGVALELRGREYVQAARRKRLVHHVRGDPAQRARPADRRGLPAHGLHHGGHRLAGLPGRRPAAAHARLGRHGA